MPRRKSNTTKEVRVNLADIHLEKLKEAREILGHTSRSETVRWLALNAIRFANERMGRLREEINDS